MGLAHTTFPSLQLPALTLQVPHVALVGHCAGVGHRMLSLAQGSGRFSD